MVRAKFMVSSIKDGKIEFSTVYDPSIPEDRRFQQATPWGSIVMQIDNPKALEQFGVGKAYYADFTPEPLPE
jgi:hypothetical protein